MKEFESHEVFDNLQSKVRKFSTVKPRHEQLKIIAVQMIYNEVHCMQ